MATGSRTVEPGITIFSAAEIRVALAPVARFPKEILEGYISWISCYRHVPLPLIKSFYRESQKSPFQSLPWKTGCLHFRFLQEEEMRRQSRLVEIHASRQVLVVLGLVHCPSTPDVERALGDFDKMCRQYPGALVYRCLVLEPGEEQVVGGDGSQSSPLAREEVVLFPPGDDPIRVQQHLEVVMHDLAAQVLTALEGWVLSAQPSMARLNTYADTAEFAGAVAVLEEVQKRLQVSDEEKEKRRWGRLQKAKGDMCLLAGSPRDAFEHYKSSMDLARTTGDLVWYGVALEGLAEARLMECIALSPVFATPHRASTGGQDPSVPPGSADRPTTASPLGPLGPVPQGFSSRAVWEVLRNAGLEGEVRDLYRESQQVYRRKGGCTPLQVEQVLKLCRYLAGVRGVTARPEVTEQMSNLLGELGALPQLEDYLVAVVEAAQVMGVVGSTRKRALLLWHAVELSRTAEHSEALALTIATKALEPPEDPQDQAGGLSQGPGKEYWWLKRESVSKKWAPVHLSALEGALLAAEKAHAPVEVWEAACTLLREHHNMLSLNYQNQLAEAIIKAAAELPPRARIRPGRGPALTVQLKRARPALPHLQPVQVHEVTAPAPGASSGPQGLLFNPYAVKRAAVAGDAEASTPNWVVGDHCVVEVVLANPSLVPLRLDQVALNIEHTEGGEVKGSDQRATSPIPGVRPWTPDGASSLPAFKALPLPVTVPPSTKQLRMSLVVIPLREGKLKITGIWASWEGVKWKEPFMAARKSYTLGQSKGTSGRAVSEKLNQRDGPTGSAVTVPVLAALPSLQLLLKAGDLQVTYPDKDGPGSPPAAPPALRDAVQPSSPRDAAPRTPTPGPASPPPSVPSPTRPAASSHSVVQVFEGQRLSWSLTLTNISNLPVTGCQLEVANQARGQVLTAQASDQLPASFWGALLFVDTQELASHLPLDPGASIDLPTSVVVGKAPPDLHEDAVVEVRVSYYYSATPREVGGSSSPSSAGSKPQGITGRRLTVPIKFVIRPTLQVNRLRLLRHYLPFIDNVLDAASTLNVKDVHLTRNPALYRSHTSKSLATHTRHRSAGDLQEHARSGLSLSPITQSGLKRRGAPPLPKSPPRAASPQPTNSSQVPGRDGGSVPAPGTTSTMSSELVLELGIKNCSDRYLRTWLARLPGTHAPAAAESAVAVLEPGDSVRLLCVVPKISNSLQLSSPRNRPVGEESIRIACAEILAEGLAVRWEMITGAGPPQTLPQGLVRLAAVEVARSLTEGALSALRPSSLQLSFTHVSTLGLLSVGGPAQVMDVTNTLGEWGIKPVHVLGKLWALRMFTGQSERFSLQVVNSTSAPVVLKVSLRCTRVGGPEGDQDKQEEVLTPTAIGLSGDDTGAVFVGLYEGITVSVPPENSVTVPFGLIVVIPGYYQLTVVDIQDLTRATDSRLAAASPTYEAQVAQIGAPSVECMPILCVDAAPW